MIETFDTELFAMARIGGINLIFPQPDIVSIESLSDLTVTGSETLNAGFVARAGVDVPVYALSKELEPRSTTSKDEHFYLCLNAERENEYIALAASAVSQVKSEEFAGTTRLPAACRTDHTPVVGVSKLKEEIVFICTAESMNRYFMSQGAIDE